jgi:hypothetical protein
MGNDSLWIPNDHDCNNDVKNRTERCIHEYLDGKWLEFHVMRTIEDIAKNGVKIHVGNSLESRKSSGGKKFELDLFVLRGYQLTGISVTTAGESEAKLKAFEVMHRVRQIGGDESRGILVANLSKDRVAEMAGDINFLLQGSTSDYFNVIGREDWAHDKLKNKLEKILWS